MITITTDNNNKNNNKRQAIIIILLYALTSLILLNALTLPTSSGAAGLDDRSRQSGRRSQSFEPLPYESPALQQAINISARALIAPNAREETERLL